MATQKQVDTPQELNDQLAEQRELSNNLHADVQRRRKGFTELGKLAFPHLQRPVLEKGTIRLPNRVWAVLESVTCDNETRDALILDAVKDYFWKSGWTIDSNLNFKYDAQGELFADQRPV